MQMYMYICIIYQAAFYYSHTVPFCVQNVVLHSQCPSGYAFFVPISGYENWQLYQAALRALQHTSFTALWINIKH